MTERKKKVDQPNLFGKVDEVYNALETERTYIVDEIKDCSKAIDRKKAVIRILDDRKTKLDRAIKTVRAQREEYKSNEPKVEITIDAKKIESKLKSLPKPKPRPKLEYDPKSNQIVKKPEPKPKPKPKPKPRSKSKSDDDLPF